jgi:RNA polymerase sigma factor (sigma-70 family)
MGAASLSCMSEPKENALLATRHSLIARLHDWDDQRRWQEFFDTYWQLIYHVACRAGLKDDEAQEVVQETCIAVAKNVTKYDPKQGPFKAWLLHMARWRITDQFRRRPKNRVEPTSDDTRGTAAMDRLAGDGEANFEQVWDEEWQRNALEMALTRVKRKVSAKHYQIFDCTALKGWGAAKTAKTLGVNIAQVYLVKHRMKGLLKAELADLEK